MSAVKGGIAWTPVKVVTTLAIFVFAGLAGKQALLPPNLYDAECCKSNLEPKMRSDLCPQTWPGKEGLGADAGCCIWGLHQ
jgi:hypothetical protein